MQPISEYGLSPEQYEQMLQEVVAEEGSVLRTEDELDWIAVARDAYDVSDTFFGSSLGKQIQKNLSLFNSRHPSGSKYHSEGYKFRSKIFRPKVRSSIRRHEAAAAQAYFASEDIVLCSSENEGDDQKSFSAHLAERLLNYRLKQPEFKWFQTCIGAYQDTMVQGAVISRQEWDYRELVQEMDGYTNIRTVKDTSACTTVPIENFRFDPNADWRDPICDSPYLIELIPMYRGDIKAQMGKSDKDPSKRWLPLSDEQLATAETDRYSTQNVRDARTDGRQDAKDQTHQNSDFDILWVHRNIIRMDNEDWIYYTLGTEQLLSEPSPLVEVFPQGRPYVMGVCNLESHKALPAAYTELMGGIQQEINDIANQRLDNVKLVVNRRSFVRRGAKVDTRGLTRSVPGGVTLVDDINQDVRYDAPPDVTSSSYEEQDRLNIDFDELAGAFSSSSVASNRQMNETVGGMEILTADSSSVQEYQLRIFAETWVKPVLRQILRLEQEYISDMALLQTLAPEVPPRESIMALQDDIKVKLNVGAGATTPQRRIEKLSLALNTVAGFMPNSMQRLEEGEVMKEIFGALGYQDGSRFFRKTEEQDPRITELEQQVQQMQQMLQGRQMELENKLQVEQVRQQGAIQKEQIKSKTQMSIAQLQQQIDYIDQQIAAEQSEVKIAQLQIQRASFEQSKKMQEYQVAADRKNTMSEMLMNNSYGMAPGIEERPGRG